MHDGEQDATADLAKAHLTVSPLPRDCSWGTLDLDVNPSGDMFSGLFRASEPRVSESCH